MKKAHRLLASIFILSALLASLGCGSGDRLSTQEEKPVIKVIVKKVNYDFWEVVKMGTEAAGKEFGVTVDYEGPTDENDIDGQISMVDAAIREKVDALVLAAGDYVRLVDVTEKAVSEGIPVIIIDSGLNSDRISGFVGTDNVEAGKKLGETLIGKVGDNCDIAVMSFVKGTATSVQREEGLAEAIKAKPGIKLLSTEYCNSDENTAQELTEELVRKYPGLDVIVCLNAYGTTGTARAINKLNLAGKVKVIGFDSTPEEISLMEKDVIQSLVIQNPFSMGYQGVKYALDAIRGQIIPRVVNTDSTVIDKENMYLPENQKLVFPFTN